MGSLGNQRLLVQDLHHLIEKLHAVGALLGRGLLANSVGTSFNEAKTELLAADQPSTELWL